MTSESQIVQQGITQLGFRASDEQVASLISYLDILEETNRSFNLTRIPRNEYATLHILDSLTALKCIPSKSGLKILDIGTGAGFPGVPLATLLPDAYVTLLDSTAKKVRFAQETAHLCGIHNCTGIHARAENLSKDSQHRGNYDVVVSRAVAAFDSLITLMLPFVRPGGIAIALKGAKADEELQGTESILRSSKGKLVRVESIPIPATEIVRQLILVEKL